MKVYISADIEGVNGICNWNETEASHPEYQQFRKQMSQEVACACLGAKAAGATMVYVKDAHDSARNIDVAMLPDFVKLHRGWEGGLCSMMAGLDRTFDAVMFVGYHSPSRSDGNPLSHTMNTHLYHVKINGIIASEFYINALYAAYLGIPVAFLSGDLNLTKQVKTENKNIETVATKEGAHGAVVSRHPSITNQEITDKVKFGLSKDLSKNILTLPKHFHVEVAFKDHNEAYRNSFYPGCILVESDTVEFDSDDYQDVLRMFKFVL